MTATNRLRQLLDERGVEWRADESSIDYVTEWDAGPAHATFYESKTTNPDMLEVRHYWPTPKQAVEATLGRDDTCHETMIDRYWRGCSKCGYTWEFMYSVGNCARPKFCPECGRRVEE